MAEELDYKLETIDDRLNLVESILEKHSKELVKYVSDYYNPHLKKTSLTSESLPVSRNLEIMADYLLYAQDKNIEGKEQEKEPEILSSYKEDRNTKREISINSMSEFEGFSQPEKKSVYKIPTFKVCEEDRKKHQELRETGEAIKKISKMIKTKKTITTGEDLSKEELRRLRKIRIDLHKDEVAMKKSLKQYVMLNTNFSHPEKNHVSLSYLRFDDINIVKELLSGYNDLVALSSEDTFGYLKPIMITFDEIIAKADLEPCVKDVLELRIQGETYKSIISHIEYKHNVNITYSKLARLLNKTIPEAIVESYRDIKEDWVFTYIFKGKYRTCTKCTKTYIENVRHFPLREKNTFRSTCHKCTKLQQKAWREKERQ